MAAVQVEPPVPAVWFSDPMPGKEKAPPRRRFSTCVRFGRGKEQRVLAVPAAAALFATGSTAAATRAVFGVIIRIRAGIRRGEGHDRREDESRTEGKGEKEFHGSRT